MNKKNYSEEEYTRMHNEVCATANLSTEELAERAGVTVKQAEKFFADQKAKILAAAEKDREDSIVPTVNGRRGSLKPTDAEWAQMLKKARAERDEWEKRYNALRDKCDRLEKDNEAFSREYERLMENGADTRAQEAIAQCARLKMLIAELYIELKSGGAA